ncbi:HTH CENPB-type domain-containing protein [Nephila pilipes]|uniref:HTH CENPB-type domain-containing protein n=1 Tax=Nephila pilipes TaxID=299642 RepID=A0A8X6T7P4_NEPPI|nr:HTH CENPB-type domain-containing protein [Nephila pilipes]
MPSIQKETRQIKSHLVIIPNGMTRLLQSLDDSVNKPTKETIRRKWNAWLSDGNHTYTAGGRMRQPTIFRRCKMGAFDMA